MCACSCPAARAPRWRSGGTPDDVAAVTTRAHRLPFGLLYTLRLYICVCVRVYTLASEPPHPTMTLPLKRHWKSQIYSPWSRIRARASSSTSSSRSPLLFEVCLDGNPGQGRACIPRVFVRVWIWICISLEKGPEKWCSTGWVKRCLFIAVLKFIYCRIRCLYTFFSFSMNHDMFFHIICSQDIFEYAHAQKFLAGKFSPTYKTTFYFPLYFSWWHQW